jgi:hypothetical protein
MPLFFFLSGLVFSDRPFKELVKKKIARLVIPYFCLGAVIYAFYAIVFAFQHAPAEDYWQMLINFVTQRAFWTIWFLAALFIGEIIVWAILHLSKHNRLIASALSIALCAITFAYYRLGGTTLPWCADVACIAQFFILLGCFAKPYMIQMHIAKPKIGAIAIVAFLANIIAGFLCIRLSGGSLDMSVGQYGNELLSMVSAICGIVAITMFCQLYSTRLFRYLGQNTMVFFAWHSRIVLVACGMIFSALNVFQDRDSNLIMALGYTIVVLIAIFVLLYPATEIIKRTKYHAFFGV